MHNEVRTIVVVMPDESIYTLQLQDKDRVLTAHNRSSVMFIFCKY